MFKFNAQLFAHKKGGVFYLRIEDTDEKRKVEGAVETIINVMRYFNIEFDDNSDIEEINTLATTLNKTKDSLESVPVGCCYRKK